MGVSRALAVPLTTGAGIVEAVVEYCGTCSTVESLEDLWTTVGAASSHPELECLSEGGVTALMNAARYDRLEIVKYLLLRWKVPIGEEGSKVDFWYVLHHVDDECREERLLCSWRHQGPELVDSWVAGPATGLFGCLTGLVWHRNLPTLELYAREWYWLCS